MADERRYSTTTAKVLAEAAVEREARKTRRALWLEEAIRAFWPVWAVEKTFMRLAGTTVFRSITGEKTPLRRTPFGPISTTSTPRE